MSKGRANVCLALLRPMVLTKRGCDLLGESTANRRRRRAEGNFSHGHPNRPSQLAAPAGWRLDLGCPRLGGRNLAGRWPMGH